MLPILLNLVLWLPAVHGWGAVFAWLRRRYGGLPAAGYEEIEALLGVCVVATLATLLHFFVAINGWAAGGLLAGGWLLAGLRLRAERKAKVSGALLAAGAIWLVVLALAAAQPPRNYDTGLYYLQSIAWLRAGPLAVGLGNLHGRLAYNSSWFAAAAALEVPGLAGSGAFVMSPLILWVWGMAISRSALRLLRTRAASVPDLIMGLSAGAFFLGTGSVVYNLGSPAPDLPALALAVFLTVAFCRFLLDEARRGYDVLLLLALSLFAVTVKLSLLPLLALPAAAGLRLMVRHPRGASRWRQWALLAALTTGVILASWAITSFLQSGCWVYPADLTCWPRVGWSVPHAAVITDYDSIRAWARWPGQPPALVLANWDWFYKWLPGTLWQRSFSWPVGLFGIGLAGQWALSRATSARQARAPLLLYALLGLGVAYWFWSAPAIRFGEGYLWALGLLSAGEFLAQVQQLALGRGRGLPWLVPAGTALLTGVIVVKLALGALPLLRADPRTFLLDWPAIPAAAIDTIPLPSGAFVYHPATSDQCWLAPLPCTPYLDKHLVMTPLGGGRLMFTKPP